MKKVFLIFLFFFSFILFVDAGKYTFENGKSNTNDYLKSCGYTYSEKYLLNGNIFGDFSFTNGGFINLYEYLASKNDKGETYLYDYEEYWAMTKDYTQYIAVGYNTYNYYAPIDLKNVRVTEYIKNSTQIIGNGSHENPYRFVDVYRVLASSNSYGSVSPSSQDVYKSADISLNPNTGYEYNKNNCDGTVSGNKLNLDNIKNDISCYIEYKVITYTIAYDYNEGTGSNPTSYTVNDNFSLSIPTREGYTFTGWTGSNGSTPQTSVTISNTTGNKEYTANWEQSCPLLVSNYKCANKTVGTEPYAFVYGGVCDVIDEGKNNWKIYLYGSEEHKSGEHPLTFKCDTEVDVFLVGGGGGGAGYYSGGSGGCGGYTGTFLKNKVIANSKYYVTVGAGGKGGTISTDVNVRNGKNGGETSAFYKSVNGGNGGGVSPINGKCGGSGGGGTNGAGSKNGNGTNGQGTTTCEFGLGNTSECNTRVTLYSGGGGGANNCGTAECGYYIDNPGGAGGGGDGGGGRYDIYYKGYVISSGTNGEENTGGGGGAGGPFHGGNSGGSGIIVIRNSR